MLGLCLSPLVDAMNVAVAETLENMFFTPVFAASSVPSECDLPLRALIDFRGAASGTVELRVSEAQARRFAADFLGRDDESLTVEQVYSVYSEMANMVCGAMLSAAAPDGLFSLGQAQVLTNPEPLQYPTTRAYETDKGLVVVAFDYIEPPSGSQKPWH